MACCSIVHAAVQPGRVQGGVQGVWFLEPRVCMLKGVTVWYIQHLFPKTLCAQAECVARFTQLRSLIW